MQPRIYTQKNLFHQLFLLSIATFFSLLNYESLAQACQLSQGQNGGVGLPLVSPVAFERGNSNAIKSHFAEGNSVPYRVEFTTLQASQQYKIRIGFDVKKNGKHAIDYLTGFQNLKSTTADVPELVLPILGTSLESVSGLTVHSLPIPLPNFSLNSSFNSVASASFTQLKTPQGFNPENPVPASGLSVTARDKGNMTIWNGILNSISYIPSVNTDEQTVAAYIEVIFTKSDNNNAVVLAWGGHIASLEDWGQGNSASIIPGSPYHMFVDYVKRISDNNPVCSGNMDCQLSSDAVTPVPTCSIAGPERICAETTLLNYTATLDAATNGAVNYQWSLTNLNISANAQLSGISSDSTSSSFVIASVVPVSANFTEGGSFLLSLQISRGGVINNCYFNSLESPGMAIQVNEITTTASASPLSFSLNNQSSSNLSASTLLNGTEANTDFSYQWSLISAAGFMGGTLSSYDTRTPVFTASQPGSYEFKVIVTQLSAPNCIDSAVVTVVVGSLQECPSVVTNAICAGTIGNEYTASMPPATGNSYIWSVNNGAQITSANGGASLTVSAGSSSFDIQLVIDYANPSVNDLVCTYPVQVNPLPIISTGTYGPLCATSIPISLDGLPSGGSWSGTGVNGNMFDPGISGAGSFDLTYSYTDANGCSASATTTIVVNDNPVVTAGSYGPLCVSNSPITLMGSPVGGTWSGAGVSGNDFTPAASGSPVLTYSYTDANGCSASATTTIEVNDNPVVSAGSYGPLCVSNSPITLMGSPVGGTWSGTGVSGSYFDPVDAGTGSHLITYTYSDANGCKGAASTTVVVNSLPLVDAGEIQPVCSDTSSFELSGTPAGGTWSGNGVSGIMFSPAVAGIGSHVLVYSYYDANGCFATDNVTIQVNSCNYTNACTYTQGYYGSVNGNSCDEDSLYSNAVSLINRLLSAGQIVIGSGPRTITILPVDADRVNAILPGNGSPKALTHQGNIYLTSSAMSLYKGAGGRLNNNLLSQTITLALNLRIKDDLADFELETGYLHTQKIRTCSEGSGVVTCEEDPSAIKAWLMKPSVVNYLAENGGATVVKLLELANAVLGKTKLPGQAGNNGTVVPSFGDITYQIDVINNAFDKCRLFVEYLNFQNLCPVVTAPLARQATEAIIENIKDFKVIAFPNPFQGEINFSIESPEYTMVRLELYDLSGKLLSTVFHGSIQAGEKRIIQVKTPSVSATIIYRLISNKRIVTGKLIPVKD